MEINEYNQVVSKYEQKLDRYKAKCSNQRQELRRLNKLMKVYWVGINTGFSIAAQNHYRKKMIDAFGMENVIKAERGELNSVS